MSPVDVYPVSAARVSRGCCVGAAWCVIVEPFPTPTERIPAMSATKTLWISPTETREFSVGEVVTTYDFDVPVETTIVGFPNGVIQLSYADAPGIYSMLGGRFVKSLSPSRRRWELLNGAL